MGRREASRLAVLVGLLVFAAADQASAQFPRWEAKPVRPRIDVIPPLGDCLPWSYAARYNRPSYLVGKTAYMIEPSSLEAMAWQRAKQRGYYADHAPRMVTHYLYDKPWEALGVGPKPRQAKLSDGGHIEGHPTLVQLAAPWNLSGDLSESESADEPLAAEAFAAPR